VRFVTIVAAALALPAPVLGHHSDAGIDMNSVVKLEGTVTEFNWRNPHVYFTMETTDERGQQVEWTLQMVSTITVTRMGWTRDSLASGDRVTVWTHPSQDGRPYGIMDSIEKEGGVPLPTAFDRESADPLFPDRDVQASTSTLEGRWMADASRLTRYPGGFDGFFKAQLTLTEKGRAARAAYNELSDDNPESTCIGRPTPAMIVSTNIYPIELQFNEDEETITIRTEYFDEVRTVYMDGRGHPDGGERTLSGHSVGSWEGDVLVVDSRNFADHRSPYQIGVSSGAQKHVVERYRLTEGGTHMVVEFMLEDPEFIAEPLTHARDLIYSPHMEMSVFDCDPEATRRFVPR